MVAVDTVSAVAERGRPAVRAASGQAHVRHRGAAAGPRGPFRHREADAPAVVLVHGRGTDERDLLPLGAQLPEELHVLSVRAPQSMGPDSYT